MQKVVPLLLLSWTWDLEVVVLVSPTTRVEEAAVPFPTGSLRKAATAVVLRVESALVVVAPTSNPESVLGRMLMAAFVDVANVEGDDVEIKRLPATERKVHGLFVAEASVRVSWGAVEDETVSAQRGVVVPRPSAVALLFQKKLLLFSPNAEPV